MSTAPHWEPTDDATATLLDLIELDFRPFAEDDRNLIAAAIRDDADMHGGLVSSNRVRVALDGRVKPQRVGPVYRALCLRGLLKVDGWETSTDSKGKNAGKPIRCFVWTGEA